MKKVASILFWIVALLSAIGAVGNLMSNDFSNIAEASGFFIGSMIPVVLYVLSGILLFNFDNVEKMDFIRGVKARQKQNVRIIVYMVIFALLFFFVVFSSTITVLNAITSGSDDVNIVNVVINALIALLPYLIPTIIFAIMFGMYTQCINQCKMQFGYSDEMLKEYLGDESAFRPISTDGTILASDKAIFYKKLFCIIPFDQIKSIEKINIVIEQDVYFHLNNGKKIEIASKQYECVKEAFDSYKVNV